MIVTCENCQTRFKIPDEKVTEKGVKVRCTKCSHTFRVQRPAAADASVPADPFAQFAPPPGPTPGGTPLRGTPLKGTPARRSGPEDLSSIFSEPTRVADIPIPAAARPPAPAPAPVLKAGADLSNAFSAPTRKGQGAAAATTTDSSNLLGDVPPPPAKPAANVAARNAPDLDFGAPPDDGGGLDFTATGARDDLFGSGQSFLTTTSKNPLEATPAPLGSGDRGLFDIPAPPPEPQARVEDPFAAPAPPAPMELDGARKAPTTPTAVARIQTVKRPHGEPSEASAGDQAPRARHAARRVSALLVNVTVSALLLAVVVGIGAAYLNEGKLDLRTLSFAQVRDLLIPPKQVVTRDVSNGLYETRQGRAVFFVRGEVENRSETPVRARIRAEILDGDQLVRAAEGWAGEIPTPEQLYAISDADDVAALTERLSRAAKVVATGERAPFVVAFYEYPPDLSKYRLRVTVLEDGAQAAKR